jgi:Glycosyl transferase family 11
MHLLRIMIFSLALTLPTTIFAKAYVIGDLQGQLGNQMFIIAATTSLAIDNNATPVFPDFGNSLNPEWNLSHNYKKVFYHLNIINPKVKKKRRYKEPYFHYMKIPYKRNIVLSGYFQSEKYFVHNKQQIIDLFTPHPEIVSYLQSKYSDIIDHPHTVSLHMRLYNREGPEAEVHPNYGAIYFAAAMNEFPKNFLFVVFSNNMKLCKQEIEKMENPPKNIRFIEGEDYIEDFYLMSFCKHNIICNSTFSWWAAYLNQNPQKKIVVPFPWFNPQTGLNIKDLIPEEWTIIQN